MAAESIYAAQLMLTFQAVGIGEAHDDRRGRDKVIEWIGKDWVSDLVLELPSFAGAAQIGAIDTKWGNPVPLSRLIAVAAANNVNIHQWDDWFHHNTGSGSAEGIANRNRDVAASFLGQFGAVTGAHHCVILFGANHFPGATGFEILLPGLKWADLSR